MFTIGLTGGIGSGKSAASDIFSSAGVCIVDADIVAREVVEPGTAALTEIAARFGRNIVNHKNELDRSKLREIIFSTPSEKQWLEQLLHPIIREEIKRQLNAANSGYSILVSPLLFETDQHQLVKRTLLIDVPVEIQIERASKRDNNSEEQIRKIIDNQLSREYKLDKADDIIPNQYGFAELELAIKRQHLIYLELAREQYH